MLTVDQHCYRLACLVHSREFIANVPSASAEALHKQAVSWFDAAEWLDLAAGITKIDVDTTRFDESFGYCRGADNYELARSDLFCLLVTALTRFTFTWGAFETTCKIIDPPRIPSHIAASRDGIIDRMIFYLKPLSPLSDYETALAQFAGLLTSSRCYSQMPELATLRSHVGRASLGLDAVKGIRNRFAHGVLPLPHPHDPDDTPPNDSRIIDLASRLVLLSLQMGLLKFLNATSFTISLLEDEDGQAYPADISYVLSRLHMDAPGPPQHEDLFGSL